MGTIGWAFPSNNHGQEDGLNDPGIETFKDNPLRSLSREGPQNTSDAADNDARKPVEIHFDLIDLPIEKLPDAEGFGKVLSACAKYWETTEVARKFFKNAKKLMSGKKIRVLKMSDYNTTGLLGPVDDRTSDWFKLTKAVGASDKAGGAGGSFGIGKHAPFACSELRTVLYGTKDKRGAFAFQGVSKLVTHHDKRGDTTQGTGYYGLKSKNAAIQDPTLVDKLFRRTKTGTDVFILGFLREEGWAEDITKGLIESFFVSIHEGKLIARVGSVLVNRNSLPQLIKKYAAEDRSWGAASYYQALTSEDASLFLEKDFEGLGEIQLKLLPGKTYPKRVAMVRSSGMKIYDKMHFQTPIRFAGVFIALGEKLNILLKSLEPPSHDKWEDKRGENSVYAKSVLRNLHGWINDKVRSLATQQGLEELDADDLSHYLPDDLDERMEGLDSTAEGEKAEPLEEVTVQSRTYDRPTGLATGSPEPGSIGAGEDLAVDGVGSFGGSGEGPEGDGGGGTGEGGGTGDKAKGGQGRGGHPVMRAIGLKNIRVFCTDPKTGRYRILAEPDSTDTAFLMVNVIGEVGQEPAPIAQFWLQDGDEGKQNERRGMLGPLELKTGQRFAVNVRLEDALHCALGVAAYAD